MNDYIKKLHGQLRKIDREETRSVKRNKDFLSEISKVADKADFLNEKTERLKQIRNDYEKYISKLYPQWQKLTDKKGEHYKGTPKSYDNDGKSFNNLQCSSIGSQKDCHEESLYSEFLKKKMEGWKHDTSLTLHDHHSPVNSDKERLHLLEKSYRQNQQYLEDTPVRKVTELELLLQKTEQELRKLREQKSHLENSEINQPSLNGRYLGNIENYVPPYHNKSDPNNLSFMNSSVREPNNTFLPVANELRKPPNISPNVPQTNVFTSPFQPNSSFTGEENSIKILPQLLGVMPNGQLVLLPMTSPLNSTMQTFQATTPQEQMFNGARYSPVGESSAHLEVQPVSKLSTNVNHDSTVDHNHQYMSYSSFEALNHVTTKKKNSTESKSYPTTSSPQKKVEMSEPLQLPEPAFKNNYDKTNDVDNYDEVHAIKFNSQLFATNEQNRMAPVTNSSTNLSQPIDTYNDPLDLSNNCTDNVTNVLNNTKYEMTIIDEITEQSSQNSTSLKQAKGGNINHSEISVSDDMPSEEIEDIVTTPFHLNHIISHTDPNSHIKNNDAVDESVSKYSHHELARNYQNKNKSEENITNDKEDIDEDIFEKSKESLFDSFSDASSDFNLPSNADDVISSNILNQKTDKVENTQINLNSSSNLQNVDFDLQNNSNNTLNPPKIEAYSNEEALELQVEDVYADKNEETHDILQHRNTDSINKVDLFDNLELDMNDTFDEPVLFYLLENVMERVKDDQSEEVLVLNLETDIKIVNTIVGSADIQGNLTRFNASEICMAFRYHLEQIMFQNKETPFIEGKLDASNDFEGHLRDCISPRYIDVWDSLFEFLSSIMDVFEFNPSQVAAIYAFALVPADRDMADQLRQSLTNILSATVSENGDLNNRDDEDGENSPYDDHVDGKENNKSFSITEELSKVVLDKNKEGEETSLSPLLEHNFKEKNSDSLRGNDLSKTISLSSSPVVNGKHNDQVQLQKSLSLDIGSVSIASDDSESTMSFDSDGLPVLKSSSKPNVDLNHSYTDDFDSKSLKKEESKAVLDQSHTEDFDLNDNVLSRSSSAYLKMREESLKSPVHEDSDDLDDLLGESIGITKAKEQSRSPKKNKTNGTNFSPKSSVKPTNSYSKGNISLNTEDVLSPRDDKSNESLASKVKLKKPGFWDHSESESDFDVDEISKPAAVDKTQDDDDFDFDFYD